MSSGAELQFDRILMKNDEMLAGGLGFQESEASTQTVSRSVESHELLNFLNRRYQQIEVRLDPNTQSVWCYLKPDGPPSFTPALVRELKIFHRSLQALVHSQGPFDDPYVRYFVQGSRSPGIYNMGGDLDFMVDRINAGDKESLREYAYGCVDAVYQIATGFDCGIVSVAMIEGDALGGGFEGALCCHVLIAEKSVKLGLPEILFNCFPGMGAYSLLSRRLDIARAERMIFSGKIYSAQEMYDLGVVDQVVEDGGAEQAVRSYISNKNRGSHDVRKTLYQVRQRVNPLTLSELRDVTDMWVDTALRLSPRDLRRMSQLRKAQSRRLSSPV
ncbi:MAG: crotonase/enoyl-CoA hydratase family protein [Stappiaceae bacterium]